jgi:hypothetical protein
MPRPSDMRCLIDPDDEHEEMIMRWAKVESRVGANNTQPGGVETYWVFVIRGGCACGYYLDRASAERAAHAYRCGASREALVCAQTRRLMRGG